MSLLRVSAIVAAGVSFGLVYWPVLVGLLGDWLHDDNYSHGLLIIPLAAYFAWERRDRVRSTPSAPALVGVAIVALGLAMLLAGELGAERFLTRISLLVVLAGGVVFLRGWGTMRVLWYPLAFLVLMIPVPAIIFNQVALPLQLLASNAGQAGLEAAGVPVLREGNVIVLANTSLEVAEACSGIRSLISLLTLGIVYGHFTDPRTGVRLLMALLTIPVAVLTNGATVAGTGIAAHYYGADTAEGFFHTFSGWIVFLVAFALLLALGRLLLRLAPARLNAPIEATAGTVDS